VSIQAAWQFIQLVRSDPALRDIVSGLGDEPDLEALVAIATQRGLSFTEEELRSAHRHDWAARWLHAEPRSEPDHPQERAVRPGARPAPRPS
jgi:predicted ribosomally synthesized peptide with nif11-like leader